MRKLKNLLLQYLAAPLIILLGRLINLHHTLHLFFKTFWPPRAKFPIKIFRSTALIFHMKIHWNKIWIFVPKTNKSWIKIGQKLDFWHEVERRNKWMGCVNWNWMSLKYVKKMCRIFKFSPYWITAMVLHLLGRL